MPPPGACPPPRSEPPAHTPAATDPLRPVVVTLPGGAVTTVFRLLSVDRDSNPKLAEGLPHGYRTADLSLAPARLSGRNLRPGSTPGCRAGCLNGGGKGAIPQNQTRRPAKAPAWRQHPAWFRARPGRELDRFARRACTAGLEPACRLSVCSDVARVWEAPEPFARPVAFSDYTAVNARTHRFLAGERPRHSVPCFSRTEANAADCRAVLAAGGTVSVVCAGPPAEPVLGPPGAGL